MTGSFSSSTTHSLHERAAVRAHIKAYNQINFANVQALLTNARRHQHIQRTTTKLLDNFRLFCLR